MSQRGSLIVLEGIDGTGKSTQVDRLAEWLRSRGRRVVTTHEPTDGPWGRKLRESAESGRLSIDEELDLFLRDRREHVETLINPSIETGQDVILDRYYFSTMAYQGARGKHPDEIRALNEAFAPVPDLLLVLDLDVDAALERIGARGDTANEFERRDSLNRCRGIFLGISGLPFARRIDAAAPLDDVARQIREAVEAII